MGSQLRHQYQGERQRGTAAHPLPTAFVDRLVVVEVMWADIGLAVRNPLLECRAAMADQAALRWNKRRQPASRPLWQRAQSALNRLS